MNRTVTFRLGYWRLNQRIWKITGLGRRTQVHPPVGSSDQQGGEKEFTKGVGDLLSLVGQRAQSTYWTSPVRYWGEDRQNEPCEEMNEGRVQVILQG